MIRGTLCAEQAGSRQEINGNLIWLRGVYHLRPTSRTKEETP